MDVDEEDNAEPSQIFNPRGFMRRHMGSQFDMNYRQESDTQERPNRNVFVRITSIGDGGQRVISFNGLPNRREGGEINRINGLNLLLRLMRGLEMEGEEVNRQPASEETINNLNEVEIQGSDYEKKPETGEEIPPS